MILLKINLKSLFGSSFFSDNSLSIKAITRKNIPYMWGWVAVCIWFYAFFLPIGNFAVKVSPYDAIIGDTTLYYCVMLVTGSLIPFLFDGKKFVSTSFYSVIFSLICFITVLIIGSGIPIKIIMIIAVPFLGHIIISHVYAFFLILNNSEKFFSMILAVLLPKLLMYILPFISHLHYRVHPLIILVFCILITLTYSTYFIKSHTETVPSFQKVKAPKEAYSLMPVIFIVYTFNDIIAPAILQQAGNFAEGQLESFYFYGILIGIGITLFLQAIFSVDICTMLNLSSAFLVLGFVLNIVFMIYPRVLHVLSVCFGISYSIGIINIYYLAGFMIKKFQSIYFYRIAFLMTSLCYLVSFIFVKIIGQNNMPVSSVLTSIISICIINIFFILSPLFIKMLYSGEWIDDAYRRDISHCSRLEAKLKDYKLTPAEIEVCRLLLDGYTLRQIPGIQSKAYATINTYCTSIYRKLNINSRSELFLLLQDYKK